MIKAGGIVINDITYQKIRQDIIESIDLNNELSDASLLDIIDEKILHNITECYISLKDKAALRKKIFNSLRGLDILEELLEDDSITEIMVNGYENIYFERGGFIQKSPLRFASKEDLFNIIQQIVAYSNRRVNEATPITDTRLKDGSRVNIVLDPVAINGPIITIRKFADSPLTMERLIQLGSITEEVADFLEKLVISGYNIFISGGTGSGKTTFLNVLSNFIPKAERVITIEDSAELSIRGVENLVRLEMRQANVEGTGAITIRDLIRSSLRMRPDRIVVGEVRGAEALDMLQAMDTGHDGCMSTGHANSAYNMLNRLSTMSLMAMELPLAAIKSQIASALDIIIHLSRMNDRARKVLEISEIECFDGRDIVLNTLYRYNMQTGLTATGNKLKHTDKLLRHEFTI